MDVLLQQLALVSESKKVQLKDLLRVAAALQRQASRDLAPIWSISATVDGFETLEDVPVGYWPMIVMDDIGYDAAGIHLDRDNQPFALITASSNLDEWSLTASHEALEMLVDPFGNRTVPGDSPKEDQGRVNFLVEVCDPSEAAEFGYSVNGILVSDFYTPRFFDPMAASGVRYSFTGAITEPRDVLRGGYLSWLDPVSDHWWQEIWFSGDQPTFRDIGPLDAKAGSIRSQIDRRTGQETAKALAETRGNLRSAALPIQAGPRASSAHAGRLRQEISSIIGRAVQQPNVQQGKAQPQGARRSGGRRRPPRTRAGD